MVIENESSDQDSKFKEKWFFFPCAGGNLSLQVTNSQILVCVLTTRRLVKNTRVSDLAVLGRGLGICISASSQVIQMLLVQGPHMENHYLSHESRAHFIPCGSGRVMASTASQLHYVKAIAGLNSGFSTSSILCIFVSSIFLRNKHSLGISAEPVTFLSMLIQKLMMKSYFHVLGCRLIPKDDFWENWTVFWGQGTSILALVLNRSFPLFFFITR